VLALGADLLGLAASLGVRRRLWLVLLSFAEPVSHSWSYETISAAAVTAVEFNAALKESDFGGEHATGAPACHTRARADDVLSPEPHFLGALLWRRYPKTANAGQICEPTRGS
jgi:hypothetical protein